jgi:hypothetical protein
LEARRYHSACQFLSDFYWGSLGQGLAVQKELPPKLDVLSDKVEEVVVEDPKAKKAAPKGKAKEEEVVVEDPAKARAEKLRKRVEAVEDGAPAHWEFPFLAELMTKAKEIVWKPAEFGPPTEKEEVEVAVDPKAKAKPKAKADPKGKSSPTPGEEAAKKEHAPALFVDMQQALLAERVTYSHRLAVINHWAEKRLTDMSDAAGETSVRLHDWVLLRRQKELDATAGLVDVLKEHIESEELITSRLTLEGAHLHRHPNVLLKAPRPGALHGPPIIAPPIENSVPYRWTIAQLDNLLEVVQCAARTIQPGGRLLPTQALLALLLRLSQASSTDGVVREQSMVPACWCPCDVDRLTALCSLFDHPPRVGSVDCAEFLIHVGLLHSPLGWPSLDVLKQLRRDLEALVPAGCMYPDFWISTEQFEKLPVFPDAADLEGELANKFVPDTAIKPGVFDRCTAQQKWLGRVLRSFPAQLRQWQAYELELSWHKYQVRCQEEDQRNMVLLDDVKSTPSASARQNPDEMASMLAPTGLEPDPVMLDQTIQSEIARASAPPPPPRPKTPTGSPDPPAEGGINVRQLLSYLSLGSTPEDGLARAFTILGPAANQEEAGPQRSSTLCCCSWGRGRLRFPSTAADDRGTRRFLVFTRSSASRPSAALATATRSRTVRCSEATATWR